MPHCSRLCTITRWTYTHTMHDEETYQEKKKIVLRCWRIPKDTGLASIITTSFTTPRYTAPALTHRLTVTVPWEPDLTDDLALIQWALYFLVTVLSRSNFAALRSRSAFFASSRPSQLWLSNSRCFAQKSLWQKSQPPTIGDASALHGKWPHRGLFERTFFFGVHVFVTVDEIGSALPDAEADGGAVFSAK